MSKYLHFVDKVKLTYCAYVCVFVVRRLYSVHMYSNLNRLRYAGTTSTKFPQAPFNRSAALSILFHARSLYALIVAAQTIEVAVCLRR